ncbi:hypothetical protein Z517_04323 [Fonsecaea pedrosoi CBS 271.37]|uniref:FAD-binding domain-containing protein n=1 Tax=Fonsecaea pedrosoi CBS 271.37 TaxID=1442368 RepID=A0A0D2GKD8_9EURO|nr:uncharacterized protein Z517_04323 [Fonsecaea pedrosoi CBS 271.37]KIW81298.1 hypothetical protein Z517_04323 [Fonsecaea pedrosoi CBS 271.37]
MELWSKKLLSANPNLARYVHAQGQGVSWVGKGRRLYLFPLSNEAVVNVIATCPSLPPNRDSSFAAAKEQLLDLFEHFDSSAKDIISLAEESTFRAWNHYETSAPFRWSHGRSILIGDAAHPLGTSRIHGPSQALEDAAALAAIMPAATSPDAVPFALQFIEELRRKRVEQVQHIEHRLRAINTVPTIGQETEYESKLPKDISSSTIARTGYVNPSNWASIPPCVNTPRARARYGGHRTMSPGLAIRYDSVPHAPSLIEDQTDAILGGHDDSGMAKLYVEIDFRKIDDKALLTFSWRGKTFVEIGLDGLAAPAASKGPEQQATSGSVIPKLPPETGIMYERYVGAVGQPGVADVQYPVYTPFQGGGSGVKTKVTKTEIATGGSATYFRGDELNLPTWHGYVDHFAELPFYGFVSGSVVQGTGVDDNRNVMRIE